MLDLVHRPTVWLQGSLDSGGQPLVRQSSVILTLSLVVNPWKKVHWFGGTGNYTGYFGKSGNYKDCGIK